jgi:hypothetical protein
VVPRFYATSSLLLTTSVLSWRWARWRSGPAHVLHSPVGHALEGQHCPTSAAFTINVGQTLFVPGINFSSLSTLLRPTCVRTICNMSSTPIFDYFSLNKPLSNATEQFNRPDAPDMADALDDFFGVDSSEAACMVSGPTIWFPD